MASLALETHTFKTKYTREVRKWSSAMGVYEVQGHETAELEITIDLDAIVKHLAHKAMANKGKVAREIGGAVAVRAVRLVRT